MECRTLSTTKIVQHNVLKWTYNRRNELSNIYRQIDPDIILLNSTGINGNDRIKLYPYNVYQRNRESEQNAGIAIAVKRNIDHVIWDDFKDDILAIRVQTTKGPVIVGTGYRPPRRENFPMEDLTKIFRRRDPVYFLADLNIRHQFVGHNDNNTAGVITNNMISRNLVSFVGPDLNIRTGQHGVSRPDIILRNNQAFLNYSIREGDLTTSDHIPVIFTISTTAVVKDTQGRKQYSRTNWEEFKRLVENYIDVKQEERDLGGNRRGINMEIIDKELGNWFNIIQRCLNNTTPNRMLSYIPHPKESDLLKALHMAYSRIRNNLMTPEIRIQILYLQDELKRENIRFFNEKWEEMICKLQAKTKDPKMFWDGIRRLMGGKSITLPTYVYDEQGGKMPEKEAKLDRFIEVWKNIFKISDEESANFDLTNEQLVTNFIEANKHRIEPYQFANRNRLNNNDPLTKELTYNEMMTVIRNFKNKTPGESGITRSILLQLPRNALERLNNIVNLLLSMGYFSILFKNGHMVMTPKGDDARHVINYRPIMLLEVPAKILERTIDNRLYKFLEDNNLFHINQYGFRRKMGTELAITKIYETIAFNQRDKSQCNVVCRDVAKAFAKVWHAGLQYKI